MKTYLVLVTIFMIFFTGFFISQRPSSFEETSIEGDIWEVKQTEAKKRPSQKLNVNRDYPKISYVAGEVSTKINNESFHVEPNRLLELGEELTVKNHSVVIIKLGPQQFLRLSENSHLKFLSMPENSRGYIQFELLRGELFTDFFKHHQPIGIKLIHYLGHTTTQNATFHLSSRNHIVKTGVDRGAIQFKIDFEEKTHLIYKGQGSLFQDSKTKIDHFEWVKKYPWDRYLKELYRQGKAPASTVSIITKNRHASY